MARRKNRGQNRPKKRKRKLPKPRVRLSTRLRVPILIGTTILGIGVASTFANWERFHRTGGTVAKTTERKTTNNPFDNPETRRMTEEVRSVNGARGSSGLTQSPAKRLYTKLKESKKQNKDKAFGRFKHLFSGGAMRFEQAALEIGKATGVEVKGYSFKRPDPFGLTTTKRFYATNLYHVVLPGEGGFVKPQVLPLSSNHVFDTHANGQGDGRIAALAAYILSKNKCSVDNPGQAVKTIAWWVMNNVKMDIWGQQFQQGSRESSKDFLKRQGYGITNNHGNSFSILNTSGICMDYVNFTADLLNSVGIPSRGILVSTNGLPKDAYPDKDSVVTHAHSVLEATTGTKPSYYEVTPFRENNRLAYVVLLRIDSLADFATASFEAQYPSMDVFRALCLRSLPEERLADYPGLKEALDLDMKGIKMITTRFRKTPSGRKTLKRFLNGIASELIIVFKDRFVRAWRASRRRLK